jgi:hypothetical protein
MTNAERQQRHQDRVRARLCKRAPKERASPAVIAPPPAQDGEGHCFLCRRPVEKVEALIATGRKRSRPEASLLCFHASACRLGLDRWPQRANGPSLGQR